jgi:DNA-binding PadR family transcriptional regulator
MNPWKEGSEGRGGRGGHGWFGGHGGHGEHGHGPFGGRHGQRIFEQGEVRYVILALLAERPSYGYELIKEIEERLNGAYSPSPGLVYPTLTMLEEAGYTRAETGDGDKKRYTLTEEGQRILAINRPIVDAIFARMAHFAARQKRAEAPQIVRALQNLRLTLQLKSGSGELTDPQVRAIADALDEAARKIEQC